MRDDYRPMNGHQHPSWELFDILSGIRHDIGGLKSAQDMHLQETRAARRENREDINELHRRIDRQLALPSRQPPPPSRFSARAKELAEWAAPLRELVTIVCLVAAGIAGLTHAPEVKEALMEVAGSIASRNPM